MPEPVELNVQTVTGGQQGPRVCIALASDWTIGQLKAALSAKGCGPAARISLMSNGAFPTNATLVADLANPASLIASTPVAPKAEQGLTIVERGRVERKRLEGAQLDPEALQQAETKQAHPSQKEAVRVAPRQAI